MKCKSLVAATTAALGLLSASAMAFNPTTTPPAYSVVMSGATASSNSVRTWVIDNLCDSSQPIDVFRRWTGTSYGNDWGIACRTNTAAGNTAKNVLFRKRDQGGSGWGVTPVTNAIGVSIMKIATGAGQNCGTSTTPKSTGAGTNYHEWLCGTTDDANVIPDAGFSDIEPDKFRGLNTPSGLPEFNSATALAFTSTTFGGLVFNTPVTTDLRNALQAVQGLTVGSDTEANMPSLSTTEIRSLFTGGVKNWDSFMVTNPANPGGAKIALSAHPAVVALGTVPADKKVQICRRVNGSGTQAQFNAIMLNYPCDAGASTALAAPGNTFAGPVVAENSGSSDVGRCLDDFNDASNASGKNATLTKRWAIGLQSTENNTNLAQSYRFIKMNGAAPTIQQVHAGNYEDYAEQSFQYRTNINQLYNASSTADKNDTIAMLAYIGANANTPGETASINSNYVHPWGQGGWLVSPKSTGGFSPSNPFSITNPVNSSTRAPFGKSPNTCHFPTTIKTVQVDG